MFLIILENDVLGIYDVLPSLSDVTDGAKVYEYKGALEKRDIHEEMGSLIINAVNGLHNRIEMPSLREERYVVPLPDELKEVAMVELYIYAHYPAKKQQQDEKWTTYFTTLLVGRGVLDIESKVIVYMQSFFDGNPLEEILKDVQEDLKPAFKKLTKVAIKTHWAFLCIEEYKKAIEEEREPSYVAFPLEEL